MKRRLTLHKHTPTHTHNVEKSKENEIRRTMKTKKQNANSLSLLLSCSVSSQKTHPHMTHLCLLTTLRTINTNGKHKQAHTGRQCAVRPLDLKIHGRLCRVNSGQTAVHSLHPFILPLSLPPSLSLSTPFHHHLNHLL